MSIYWWLSNRKEKQKRERERRKKRIQNVFVIDWTRLVNFREGYKHEKETTVGRKRNLIDVTDKILYLHWSLHIHRMHLYENRWQVYSINSLSLRCCFFFFSLQNCLSIGRHQHTSCLIMTSLNKVWRQLNLKGFSFPLLIVNILLLIRISCRTLFSFIMTFSLSLTTCLIPFTFVCVLLFIDDSFSSYSRFSLLKNLSSFFPFWIRDKTKQKTRVRTRTKSKGKLNGKSCSTRG